ncbi:MAG TPA: DUF885 family protein [Myxococcaceae bacterium]|nr:DUF885 family protein [Myxococcaceae bacterium]
MIQGVVVALAVAAGTPDPQEKLGQDFWKWRAETQPASPDDIPRLTRPPGWAPDWSSASIARRRTTLAELEKRFRALPVRTEIPAEVDRRLLGSALARVRWETELNPGWRQNPAFYVDQALASPHELLVIPPPFDPQRSRDLVRRLDAVPALVAQARQNLDRMRGPFLRVALEQLRDVRPRLSRMAKALRPVLTGDAAGAIGPSAERAGAALESFRTWLEQRANGLPEETAIGREAYLFFLREVALVPFTPEQLVASGRQELDRALTFEALALNRSHAVPPLPLLPGVAAVVERERADEERVRKFYVDQQLLTLPTWLGHYRFRPMPDYLAPMADVGVPDDLTGPGRLNQDGSAYVEAPSERMGYFQGAAARDPRLQIMHEGAHYLQTALSSANPRPLRRYYYDSGTPEGLAFYDEEMLLQAGLFDDSPRSRDIVYNMIRLRALRVEVDVKLALGQFTLDQAADYLATTVPMDRATARAEAALFASTPGQAISYQTGKLQILRLLADARLRLGERFRLRDLHDFLFANGYVPLSLLRWEYLGLRDEVDLLERLR